MVLTEQPNITEVRILGRHGWQLSDEENDDGEVPNPGDNDDSSDDNLDFDEEESVEEEQ